MSLADMFNYRDTERQLRDARIDNSRLEDELSQCKKDLSKSRSTVSMQSHKIDELNKKIDDLENLIHTHAPLFDSNLILDASTFEAQQKVWSIWNSIDDDDYSRSIRQERACEARFTPLEVNPNNGIGHFRGIDEDYTTSLKQCTCMDFQRRLRPCKHMYRLAYELDVFMLDSHVDYVPEPQKIMHKKRLKYLMQTLSSRCLEYLDELKYDHVIVAKRSDVAPMLSLGIVIICPDKFPLLDSYKKDELLSLIPSNSDIKRSCKKVELIEQILASCPDLISELERLTIPIQLSPYVEHLRNYI